MLATIHSAAVIGIDAYDVAVEVDCAPGLPQFTIVGLPAGAVKESRERVSAALVNSGFALPPRRTTVNLAPADTRKEGSQFDVPMALALLVATGQLSADSVRGVAAVGELGLDGGIRPVRGVLSVARRLAGRCDVLLVPPGNVTEAQMVSGVRLAAPASFRGLVDGLRTRTLPPPDAAAPHAEPPPASYSPDLADVVGQELARRALEIAAAGDHGMILIGPPGAGKTLLARCMPALLPGLREDEALEVVAIHSIAGLLQPGRIVSPQRPFRAPHHTISAAGLIGGGSSPRPGEVSLAHRGVLFLDEMLEFPRYTLDALRQPLEDGDVVIARAAGSLRFPARFTLVGAMNPCPCGHAGHPAHACVCTTAEITSYRGRLSGPLADRIDLHVTVTAVPVRQLGDSRRGECSAVVRTRVERARNRQLARYARVPGVICNGRAPGRWLQASGTIESAARELLATAAERLGLSARAFHRVLRVARTIADLDESDIVAAAHVAEALRYRTAGMGVAQPALPPSSV